MRGVLIELDKPRRLRYDINALSDLENAMGTGLAGLLGADVGIRTIRALLWAGLLHEAPRLTQAQAGAMMEQYLADGGTLSEIEERIMEAIQASPLFRAADDDPNEEAGAEN